MLLGEWPSLDLFVMYGPILPVTIISLGIPLGICHLSYLMVYSPLPGLTEREDSLPPGTRHRPQNISFCVQKRETIIDFCGTTKPDVLLLQKENKRQLINLLNSLTDKR